MATALGLNAVDETGKLGTTKKRKESDGSAVAGDEDEMFAVTLRIQEWSCGPEGDHRSGLPTITACVVRGSENAKAYAVRLKAHMLGAMVDEAADLDGMGWAVRMGSHTWDGPGGGQGGEDIEDIDWDARLKGYECTVAKLCSETSMLDTVPRVDLSAL